MKAKRFLMILLSGLLLTSCGQNTTQNDVKVSDTHNTNSVVNNGYDENYQDVDTLLRLPLTEDQVVPVGTYVSSNQKVVAIVEYPNETNTQNLDMTLITPDTKTSLKLTDTEGFWKVCIYSDGYYPIQFIIEDIEETNQLEHAVIQKVSANRVTTIYNTTPWPKGDYLVQFNGATPDKSYVSIETGSSLAELGLSTTSFNK